MKRKEAFTHFFKNWSWQGAESASGTGSSVSRVVKVIELLPFIFKKYDIKTMLDAPCGDFNWMKEVDLSSVDYTGVDIVTDLITGNEKYKKDNIDFKEMDIVQDVIPKVDLIFCRDCLVHLSYDETNKFLNNFVKSESKYLMTSHFPEIKQNCDNLDYRWRPINLNLEPYNFPESIENITEEICGSGLKCIPIWTREQIERTLK